MRSAEKMHHNHQTEVRVHSQGTKGKDDRYLQFLLPGHLQPTDPIQRQDQHDEVGDDVHGRRHGKGIDDQTVSGNFGVPDSFLRHALKQADEEQGRVEEAVDPDDGPDDVIAGAGPDGNEDGEVLP